MDFFEAALGRRSCRRFRQDPIPRDHLDRMIDAGRYVPTGFNCQPVRFAIISSPEKVAEAFGFTGWLTGRPGDDERPAAYVVTLADAEVHEGQMPPALAAYAVMTAAYALGYGSCWHGVRRPDELRELLGLPERFQPHVLISLGKPAETIELHDPSDETKVTKDDAGVVHVGKLGRETVTVAVV
jgi:FMN reductase [NAD(P)H]